MMTVGFPPSVSPGLDEQGYPTKGFLQKIESFRPQEAKGWALLGVDLAPPGQPDTGDETLMGAWRNEKPHRYTIRRPTRHSS